FLFQPYRRSGIQPDGAVGLNVTFATPGKPLELSSGSNQVGSPDKVGSMRTLLSVREPDVCQRWRLVTRALPRFVTASAKMVAIWEGPPRRRTCMSRSSPE